MVGRRGGHPLSTGRADFLSGLAPGSPSGLSFGFLPGLGRLRLASGLVVAAFAVTHFANHALGLVSLQAMEGGRVLFALLWNNPLAVALLYGALGLHVATGLVSLYRRRTLRMPWREAAQYALGFALPFLLVSHVVATRVSVALGGAQATYPDMVRFFWIVAPEAGLQQVVALAIVWAHLCLGIWYWRRGRPGFAAAAPWLFAVALLLPLVSVLGVVSAGKELAAATLAVPPAGPDPVLAARLDRVETAIRAGLALALAFVVAAQILRRWREHGRRVWVRYPDGRRVAVPMGFTVLEASRQSGIPHLSVCGGRGRCSTCRVRVLVATMGLPPPGETERATLGRIRAGDDVRLACQLRPHGEVAVVPLMSPAGERVMDRGMLHEADGHEREVVALFCDLRGFTRLVERRLPFDTVYLLNRYFAAIGEAVEREGGHLDKFIGDGALALFGLETTPAQASRQALRCARAVARALDGLDDHVRSEFGSGLRLAIGIHAGQAVVGRMGYGSATTLTAVGDTINTASRLEGLAKEFDAFLVASADVAHLAGVDLAGHDVRTVPLRGRAAALRAWVVQAPGGLDAALGAAIRPTVPTATAPA